MRRYPVLLQLVFTSRLMRNGGRLYDTCAHASVDTCAYLKQRFSKRVQIGYTCSINVAFDKKSELGPSVSLSISRICSIAFRSSRVVL